jgi:hypothetical protein
MGRLPPPQRAEFRYLMGGLPPPQRAELRYLMGGLPPPQRAELRYLMVGFGHLDAKRPPGRNPAAGALDDPGAASSY